MMLLAVAVVIIIKTLDEKTDLLMFAKGANMW